MFFCMLHTITNSLEMSWTRNTIIVSQNMSEQQERPFHIPSLVFSVGRCSWKTVDFLTVVEKKRCFLVSRNQIFRKAQISPKSPEKMPNALFCPFFSLWFLDSFQFHPLPSMRLVYLPTFSWIFLINVGKYTSLMDPSWVLMQPFF